LEDRVIVTGPCAEELSLPPPAQAAAAKKANVRIRIIFLFIKFPLKIDNYRLISGLNLNKIHK
jgi:hypothetical protein